MEAEAARRGTVQQVLLRLTPGIDPHTYAAVATGKVDSKFGQAIETGQGQAGILRAARFDLTGARPGPERIRPGASCAEAMGSLWMPEAIELISPEAAENARLLPGTAISYVLSPAEGASPAEGSAVRMRLYFDENDALYLLELGAADIRRD